MLQTKKYSFLSPLLLLWLHLLFQILQKLKVRKRPFEAVLDHPLYKKMTHFAVFPEKKKVNIIGNMQDKLKTRFKSDLGSSNLSNCPSRSRTLDGLLKLTLSTSKALNLTSCVTQEAQKARNTNTVQVRMMKSRTTDTVLGCVFVKNTLAFFNFTKIWKA